MKSHFRYIDINILTFLLILSFGFGNFNISIGFSLKAYMIITFITAILTLSITKIKKLESYEKIMVIYFIWYFFTIIQFRYVKESLWYSGVLIIIAAFYFTIKRTITYVSIQYIEKSIRISGLIICLASLTYYYIGIKSFGFFPTETQIMKYGVMIDRYMFRLMGTINEPNITCIYVTPFLMYYIYHYKQCVLNKIGCFTCLLTIILTLSRGAYICIASIFVIIPFFSNHKKEYLNKLIKYLFLFGCIIAIAYYILLPYDIDILAPITNRFTEIKNDSGSGRLDLWRCAYLAFLESPIIGIGLNSIRAYNIEHFGIQYDNYTHNSYLEVLAESGIIGFFLFILMLLLALNKIISIQKRKPESIYLLASFIAVMLQMAFVSVQHNEIIFLLLLLIFRYGTQQTNTNTSSSCIMYEAKLR